MSELLQSEWEKINHLIFQINDILDSDLMRSQFLHGIQSLIPFDYADFCLVDLSVQSEIRLISPIVVSHFSKEFEEKFTSEYEDKFEKLDYTKWVFSSSDSIVFRESDIINQKVRMKSSYYSEYLQPVHLTNVICMSLVRNSVCLGAITLYRTEANGDFAERDVYILNQFLPHLETRLLHNYPAVPAPADPYAKISFILTKQYHLSGRELEIVKLVSQGLNNQEISSRLYITVSTVKKHIGSILNKLHVENRVQLINFLIRTDKNMFSDL